MRCRFITADVFTSRPEGNPLAVFPDARWVRVMAAVAGGAAGSAAAAIGAGTLLWNRSTARALGRLAPSGAPGTFTPDQLAGLPAPVVRYFEFALTPGRPLILTARIEHEGEFRDSLDAPWSPFKSVQHFSVDPPGFVWDAAIRMGPLMTVRVRDSYLQGVGSMQGNLAGLIPVVNAHGGAELASGSLHRYLAESGLAPHHRAPPKTGPDLGAHRRQRRPSHLHGLRSHGLPRFPLQREGRGRERLHARQVSGRERQGRADSVGGELPGV